MKKFAATLFIAIALAILPGCATNPSGGKGTASPEAQIKAGANAHAAASTLATVLLKNDKITVAQAKGYSTLLHASSDTLDSANKTLLDCRKQTKSTAEADPDPCAFSVLDLIRLASEGIANVKKTLDSK